MCPEEPEKARRGWGGAPGGGGSRKRKRKEERLPRRRNLCAPTPPPIAFATRGPPSHALLSSQLFLSKDSWGRRERERAVLQHDDRRLPKRHGKFPAVGGGVCGGVDVHALLPEGGERGWGSGRRVNDSELGGGRIKKERNTRQRYPEITKFMQYQPTDDVFSSPYKKIYCPSTASAATTVPYIYDYIRILLMGETADLPPVLVPFSP